MTAIGTPTMTDAEERAWTEAQRSGRDWRGKPERKDHAYDWKRASQARPKAGAPVRNGCVHHWRIPEPDGTNVLTGECGRCGATRGFFAGMQDWSSRDSNAASVLTDPRDAQERTTLWEEMRQ